MRHASHAQSSLPSPRHNVEVNSEDTEKKKPMSSSKGGIFSFMLILGRVNG